MARVRRIGTRGPFDHTIITVDVTDMLAKVEYEIERYRDLLDVEAEEAYRPLVWQAMNVCQTFRNAEVWAEAQFSAALTGTERRQSRASFGSIVQAELPWQGAVAEIADTMRHHRYRDTRWPDGRLRLLGVEFPSLGITQHYLEFRDAVGEMTLAENVFGANLRDWHVFVIRHQIV